MFYLFGYTSTGQITCYIECADPTIQIPPTGGGFITTAQNLNPIPYMEQNYVANGAIAACTALPATVNKTTLSADGVDEAIISDIPSGIIATIAGVVKAGPETITDGELIITSNAAGTIQVTLAGLAPYLKWSTTFNAS